MNSVSQKKKTPPLLRAEKKIDNYVWNASAYLGSGPSGKVYKGIDLRSHSPVAIKIIEIEEFPSLSCVSALNEETSFLKNISNPFLVGIFDIFLNKRHLYIIEEYCHQGDLRKCLSLNRGQLTETLIFSLFKQLILGIQALQSFNLINCNLKPENIMLTLGKGNESNNIKIADFWISRVLKFVKLLNSSGFGLYHSPQILTRKAFTCKAEVWTLGLMLYEIVFGKLPWMGANIKEMIENIREKPLKFPFRVEVSPEIKNILKGCLQYEEENRSSLKEVIKNKEVLKEIIQKKARFPRFDEKTSEVLQKLQVLITQQNIQIEKIDENNIFQKRRDNNIEETQENSKSKRQKNRLIYLQDFAQMIKVLDSSMDLEEIELFYERLDPYKRGLYLEDLKELLFERDFSIFEGYEDPFLEEKSERVMYILRETIQKNKIDIENLFLLFDVSGNNELSYEEFERLLLTIHPIISPEESNYLFQKLDYDNSGDINLNEFKTYVQRDGKLEEKLRKCEGKFTEIRKELRHLIKKQKVKVDKVFEKFKMENEKDIIGFEGVCKFLKVLDPGIQDEEAEYIFQRVDVDRNRLLTKEKFIEGFLD